jgi:DNA-binding LacI/PurR family transcriptional regulator
MADRRAGYLDALAAAGVDPDANLLHEGTLRGVHPRSAMEVYLDRARPTAVVFGASWLAQEAAGLATAGKIRVPRDLSVVVYDQAPEIHAWFGMRVAHIAQPLAEEGRRLARMVRDLAEGADVARDVAVPCVYVAGESVTARRAVRQLQVAKNSTTSGGVQP